MPAAGYELEPLRVEGISRSNPLKAARAVVRAAGAVGAARRGCCAATRADAVLGGGGYVAGPVGARRAARAGSPLVLTEADSHLGLTNRLLAPRARRVCLAFPIAGRDGERYLRHRPPGAAARSTDRDGARAAVRDPAGATCVLVFGGSLGARSINEAAVEAFADAPYRVLHVAGRARLRRACARPARTTSCASTSTPFGTRARRRRPRRRARRRLGVRARPVRAAGGADPVSARLRRPPDRQRALDGGGRRGHRRCATPS